MKYIGKLFVSLKEVFITMIIQYVVLILCILTLGIDKSIIWGSIILMILQTIYIVYKVSSRNITFDLRKKSYFPYVLIGIGICCLYNMIIFRLGYANEVNTKFPIVLNILCSGIIGPIFEEFLFRYDLIRRLSKFNSSRWIIIVLSSLIFGLLHTGITTIIYAIIIGIINSYIYLKDKDIIKPIIIHVSANIFVNLLTSYNLTTLILGILLIFISFFIIRTDN